MLCLFQRWILQVEKQDTWRETRGPEHHWLSLKFRSMLYKVQTDA